MSIDNSHKIGFNVGDDENIYIEVDYLDSEIQVSSSEYKIQEATNLIKKTAKHIKSALEEIDAKSLKLEFGIELSVESGNLISIITKGSAKSNFKITIEL